MTLHSSVEDSNRRVFVQQIACIQPWDKSNSDFHLLGNRINSNLPFQVTLYLNVWAYPIWFMIAVVNLDEKYHQLKGIYKVLTVAVVIIVSVLETVRLYLGYRGNLVGKIPELSSFLLISTLIQFPLEMFLLFDGGTYPTVIEVVANSIIILLLISQIFTGTIALKNLAEHRAKLFYFSQMYGFDEQSS